MSEVVRLRSLRLVNYKGFDRYTVNLRTTNVLIGANNAGKSTALGALRLIAAMLPAARRTAPTTWGRLQDRQVRGWPVTAKAIETASFSLDNIRHDFRPDETRIELTVTNGSKLILAWAAADDDSPDPPGMFFVIPPQDSKTTPRQAACDYVPTIAVVPTLTPLDDREAAVTADTIRKHLSGRRSSRYFRNALASHEDAELSAFFAFAYEHTPEIGNLTLKRSYESKDDAFDLFYEESDTRHEREIGWAGDGMQIWIQVLHHLWRQRDAEVLVLDEPDVFLHPDLQRRLARAVFQTDQQVILATHSVEILAESAPASAVWIDRSRKSSERPKDTGVLATMGRRLGSGFELGVGRALRSRTVLFVEGDDIPLLALMAKTLGLNSVAASENYATVPLGGFNRNWQAGAFTETMDTLGADINAYIILDNDFRSHEALLHDTKELRKLGPNVHVWKRRELENYLLDATTVARVAGIPLPQADELLHSTIAGLQTETMLEFIASRQVERNEKITSTKALSAHTVTLDAHAEFEGLWASTEGPVELVDAKKVIRVLNQKLQADGHRTINAHKLAKNFSRRNIPTEVYETLSALEELIHNT